MFVCDLLSSEAQPGIFLGGGGSIQKLKNSRIVISCNLAKLVVPVFPAQGIIHWSIESYFIGTNIAIEQRELTV